MRFRLTTHGFCYLDKDNGDCVLFLLFCTMRNYILLTPRRTILFVRVQFSYLIDLVSGMLIKAHGWFLAATSFNCVFSGTCIDINARVQCNAMIIHYSILIQWGVELRVIALWGSETKYWEKINCSWSWEGLWNGAKQFVLAIFMEWIRIINKSVEDREFQWNWNWEEEINGLSTRISSMLWKTL